MKTLRNLVELIAKDTHMPVWLVALLAAVFALRIPTFFEPYWYGDETLYLTLGEGIRRGLLLYRDIHDNKPPLLYLVAGLAGNVFWFRAILTLWLIGTFYCFWRLGKLLFAKNERLIKIACITIALLTTIPLLEGTIANAEIFMIGPTIIAFMLILKPRLSAQTTFLAGILIGIAILFKVPAGFDAAVPIVLWLASLLIAKTKDWKEFTVKAGIFLGGVIFPALITFVFFGIKGILPQYITAAFLQNFGYLSAWRGGGGEGDFLSRNGPLLARAGIAAIIMVTLLVYYRRRKISLPFLFVGTWFATSLFASTLSERPYPHYLIQVVPSFSFLVGMFLTVKTREQFFVYPLFAILGATLLLFKFYYFQVFPYYQNFLLWVTGQRSTAAYFNHFDSRMNRNYAVAQYLATSGKENDRLFVWGNDAEIYTLSNLIPASRFVVAYHVADFNAQGEIMTQFQKSAPRFIVTISSSPPFPALYSFINTGYLPIQQIENATIWLRMKNTLKDKKLLPR
ncbi:hypothetical protein HY405_01080 [Candidatus Microgenomates bacterium]|nr:hypothetical protein [Candidatus Microgenomates bacterium]